MSFSIADYLSGIVQAAVSTTLGNVVPREWKAEISYRVARSNPLDSIKANHDLVRAVRLAWIRACDEVLDVASRSPADPRASVLEAERLTDFTRRTRKAMDTVRFQAFKREEGLTPSPIDRHALTVLEGTSEFIGPGNARAGDLLPGSFVETLAALTDQRPEDVPEPIRRVLAGRIVSRSGEPRSFADLVFAEFAEILKSPSRYPEAGEAFHIFMGGAIRKLGEETLSQVRSARADMAQALAQMDGLGILGAGGYGDLAERFDRYEDLIRSGFERNAAILESAKAEVAEVKSDLQDVKAMLAALGQSGANAVNAGFDANVLLDLARRVNGQIDGPAAAMIALREAVDVAVRRLEAGVEQPGNEVLVNVAALVKGGRYEEAARVASDAIDRWEAEDPNWVRVNLTQCLAVVDAAIDAYVLIPDVLLAARRVVQRVQLENAVTTVDFDATGTAVFNWFERGIRLGNIIDVQVAEAIALVMLEAQPKQFSDLWVTLTCLGKAMFELGDLVSSSQRMRSAIGVKRSLLEIAQQTENHNLIAVATLGLAVSICHFGERTADATQLEDGLQLLRSIEDDIKQAAQTEGGLFEPEDAGVAALTIGTHDHDVGMLRAAVQSYRRLFDNLISDSAKPLPRAQGALNLGAALCELGRHTRDASFIVEAVGLYRWEATPQLRENAPLAWSDLQLNLGNALAQLNRLETRSPMERSVQAVNAYRLALEERIAERGPIRRVEALSNLARTLLNMTQRLAPIDTSRSEAYALEALSALEEALYYVDSKHAPSHDAHCRLLLCDAHLAIFASTREKQRLHLASDAATAATALFTKLGRTDEALEAQRKFESASALITMNGA